MKVLFCKITILIMLLTSCEFGRSIDSKDAIQKNFKLLKLSYQSIPKIQGAILAIKLSNKGESSFDSLYVLSPWTKKVINFKEGVMKIEIPLDAKVGSYSVPVFYGNQKIEIGKKIVLEVIPKNNPKVNSVKVLNKFNHNRNSYTQGIFYLNGKLYESSGQYGKSYLARLNGTTFEEEKRVRVNPNIFAEGIAFVKDRIYQLSWQEQICYIYDFKNDALNLVDSIFYKGEGWGLCSDGDYLYMSNGTNVINKINPTDFSIVEHIEIYAGNQKLQNINELELIDGMIWANVYLSDKIVVINPKTGVVDRIIDCFGLLTAKDMDNTTDVLNGIFYDNTRDKVFITGKNWPYIFEIKK